MSELIDEIKMVYSYFNDEDYVFFSLFLLSIVYIFITEKNKKVKDFFVFYSIFILAIIWNPICIYVLNKFINIGSMYRIYYMLPTCISIAYAITKLIENCKTTKTKLAALACTSILIVFFGNCIFNKFTTEKFSNFYKLPDETVAVAYLIAGDTETEEKKALVPYGMSSQIRQVCPEIKLYYSRIVSNPKDENGNSLPHDTDDPSNYEPVQRLNSGDVQYITNLCKKSNTNYIVFDKNIPLKDRPENFGFEIYAETEKHLIYRLATN